jgi:rhamnogalacturonyl hydrolase YesR
MRKLLFSLLASALLPLAYGQAPTDEQLVRAIGEFILKQPVTEYVGVTDGKTYTSTKEIPEGTEVRFKTPYTEWHYSNGVINMSMIKAGAYLKEPRFTQYALNHVAYGFANYSYFKDRFKNDRNHWVWPFGQLWNMKELDDCGAMGASVIDVYRLDPKPEYRKYIDDAARHITQNQTRLPDGTLARTFPNQMTVWADDLYMGGAFLARMADLTKEKKYYDEAIKQIKQITGYLWYEPMQLYYHCYYTDLKRTNRAHWGRANGWILYAISQLLDVLPKDHPERPEIIRLAERQILGASQYQDADGLWHQLLDKPDSYQESSICAIFTYCTAHAVNEGWIDRRYASIATAGWNGMKKKFITTDGQLKDVCPGTGTANDLAFYYNRPPRDNEKHGMGLVLDCGIEMLKLQQTLRTR